MAAFEYTALDDKGAEKKGIIESDSPRQARALLRERGLMPTNIDSAATQDRKQVVGSKPVSKRGINATELALFTRGRCHSTKHCLRLASKLKNRVFRV